ncbi:MAG: penicillin acylase family protein [Inquilinaceae bacterium]
MWRILGLLAVVVVVAVVGGIVWLRTGLPTVEGTIALPGLDAPVTVVRDADAIPHIFAESETDAMFALGYLHAQDRLWQMDMQRRIGAGRLSELVGGATLPMDRLMRTLGLYRLAEAEYERLPASSRVLMDRYAAGVNAWMDTRSGALPPEFYVLRYRPDPWRPADSLVWGKLMAMQLSSNYREELLTARIAAALGEDAVDALLPPSVGAPPTTLSGSAAGIGTIERLAAALPPPLGPNRASNAWVLAGDRTATGAPILATDPHLGLAAPILWYLVHIETPDLTLTGATVPGAPAVLIGHNTHVAWGLTTTGGDVQDLFVERLDPDSPDRYLIQGGSAPFETRTERIAVRGADPETVTIRHTRHGPVISDIAPDTAEALAEGEVMALAFTALADDDTTAQSLFLLNRARDAAAVRAAARLWVAPQQNLFYADTAGTIGFVAVGRVPLRTQGDGSRPVPGWTGEYDWTGTAPFAALPQGENPAAGLYVNANNAIVGPDFRPFIARRYDEPYRARRIEQVLDGVGAADMAANQALQMDTVSLAAEALMPAMLAVRATEARAAEALAALRRWDHRMDRDRPEPLIFVAWLEELGRVLYADELGPLFEDLDASTPSLILETLGGSGAWCDDTGTPDRTETCDDALAVSLATALDRLEAAFGSDPSAWRWGEAHIAPLAHQVFGRIPVINRLIDLSTATDGGRFTVNRGSFADRSDDGPMYRHVHGAGMRVVFDLSDLARSRFVIATGQSGHPLSNQFGAFVERWRDGEGVALTGDRAALAATAIGTLILTPASAP